MTPPIFNLGDEVEVIGPDSSGKCDWIGQKFEIMLSAGEERQYYTAYHVPLFPASSLRLVNEKPLSPMQVTYTYDPVDCECRAIQVSCPCGRKAEIAVPAELKIGDWVKRDDLVFQISDVHTGSRETLCFNESNQTWYSSTGLRKLTPEEMRLSAIEKRLSAIETLQFSQQDAIVHFENRLAFVEKFQRDQDDFVGRAIRDGVAEISDFRRKA